MSELESDLEIMVQKYVLGHLSVTEEEAFEAAFLSDEKVIEMVELAQNMNIGLAVQSSHDGNALLTDNNRYQGIIRKIWGFVSLPIPAYVTLALAAGVIPVMLGIGTNGKHQGHVELISFSTSQVRGETTARSIDLSNVNGAVGLLLKIPSVQFQYYKVALKNKSSNKVVWSSNEFEMSALNDKFLIISDDVPRLNLSIAVYGVEKNGNLVPVVFCHYSEVCIDK